MVEDLGVGVGGEVAVLHARLAIGADDPVDELAQRLLTLWRADGTPDQHNPEIIGDKDVAKQAAREQFTQQAVSAADVAESSEPVMLVGQEDGSVKEVKVSGAPQDPSIADRQSEHEKVAKSAQSAADKAVDSLTKS